MAPAIILAPIHAKVGDTVLITGSGFFALDTITFKFAGSAITPTDAPIAASAGGAFTAHIVIPASVQGVHTVEADDAHAGAGTATFTTDPKFTIDPVTGPARELITLTGSGFAGTSAVTVLLDGASATPVSPITTDSTGGLSGSLQLAAGISQGAHIITVTDASANSLTATFTVNDVLLIDVVEANISKQAITTGLIDEESIPVANDSYVTVGLIDMRNYIRATLEIFCSDSTNDLTFQILGMINENSGSVPDAASAKWMAIAALKDVNVAKQTGSLADISTRYSWLRVDVKRKSSGQDSTLDIYGRLHKV